MTEEQLQAIKERTEKATGTQWKVGMPSPNGVQNVGTIQGLMTAQVLKAEDAEFIAHARKDVPALIAEVERLKEALRSITTECLEAKDTYVEESDIDSILETAHKALAGESNE